MRQGLDFPELEQGTKIRGKYLRALEDEQFDVLPAQTYVKGFLRSYAEYLGLDGQLYVDEYNSRFVVGEEENNPSRPRRSAPPQSRGVQVQSRVVLLTLLGIGAVTALVIVAWTRGEPQKVAPVGLGTSKPLTTKTQPLTPKVVTARLLVKAVRGPCWLQVHRTSVTGPILFQGTLEQGQKQLFTARKLWITLDRPENLVTILNGHTRLLPVGGVKTLVVTPRGIHPAV
ncbi:MAG: cytoskeleton protein RodZ [Gaiellaceae bacterium]|nr:cytoskeleton protein RodZ [Gaiellaceae bacterium]MDX6387880.1 cytoskeleton protein RodZ [Gaiellaceae bacterium]MDX6436006.1 cytoskeleton protein RodZ [Gaiellaceae bacterium]